jgi:RimJ/RimL family protein N-acetyltransferase
MENVSYLTQPHVHASSHVANTARSDWKQHIPVLGGEGVRLREIRQSDAPSLFAMLTSEEVARFISPPPATLEGFERFIAWTLLQRTAGAHVCFAVTLPGDDTAIGIFQVRRLSPNFDIAEWGFAIGSPFWGTGIFADAAALVLEFVFNAVGVRRLEARAAVQNGRGNGALLKIGAVQEGILRQSFVRNGQVLDQMLYSILEEDWRASRPVSRPISRSWVH